MIVRKFVPYLFAAFVLFSTLTVHAQNGERPDTSLRTPQIAMHVHLYYLQSDSYRPAMAALSIPPDIDSARATTLAKKIKQIYDGMGLFVYLNQVPDRPNYRDTITGEFQYTPFPRQLPGISLQRIDEKWYYAKSSLRNVDALHNDIFPLGSDILINLLPEQAQEKFLGLALWQYLGIALILLLAALLHLLFRKMLNPLVATITIKRFRLEKIEPKLVRQTASIISLIILLWLVKMMVPILKLPIKGAEWTMTGLRIAMTVFIAVLLFRMTNVLRVYLESLAESTESKMDDQVLPLLDKTIKIVIVVAALIQTLSLLHVNITAIIAGVSIAGLALALATQDSVKNLIGSLMIFLDKPFQINDFVEIEGKYGTVEEVGFRSTRIRTVDTSLISIPNGTLANMMIRNMGIRFYRLFDTKLSITYDTPPELIEHFTDQIERIIRMHPMAADENYIVRFSEFGDSALHIQLRAYFRTNDYLEELKIREEFLLSIMRLADTMGVAFAFPSRTLYVDSFPGEKDEQPDPETSPENLQDKTDRYMEQLKERLNEDYAEDNLYGEEGDSED